ncbi:hypothetical protein M2459_001332 [Parabacteroides sp. PF5-5]|uniref:hypothetical protein n=1 Tax=unclassified Parabacteroides TaxID=2649774 RepID=UPI002474EF2E|nr:MULTISPECIES: hypothetical protein [unclassified Parabacteroides]MDH6304597.1 hypothetical protein [Parabacteroides sp. PH5-39]MDH6315790.1 hypothetical protein [Parabacteroides sp. PF5-13]MDH6319449.1 hypothetical protein [Parabacteroides sp. PH5-13]MDH6323180.1 hypothetical protein [Parabacteroides sp. PH5-8]MDH6326982.1 hypothetical protein [Parabacteroides sp. PH5-41]
MKTMFYNSRIAKILLPKSKTAIMLLGAVFFKKKEGEVSGRMKRHEKIHQFQYLDCFFVSLIPAVYLTIMYGIGWLLLPSSLFYVMYLLEYIVSTIIRALTGKKEWNGAYYTNAMEMQAYDLESGGKEYEHLGWFSYYGKI